MTEPPLTTLLSQALVAFVIELDEAFEQRLSHYTTDGGRRGRARGTLWLTSWAMWATYMRFVDEEGITLPELRRQARTGTNLDGMRRWGYITRDAGVIRATPAGLRARAVWAPLPEEIEGRWRARFGDGAIDRVRAALARAFERGGGALSLAICADVLRVLDERGVQQRELPSRSGVSRVAVEMALGILRKRELAVVVADPDGSRFRVVRLTPAGVAAREQTHQRLAAVERGAAERVGEEALDELRAALAAVVGDPGARPAPLLLAREPCPDGWRARVRGADVLPHFPMVLHRGGFPDGS